MATLRAHAGGHHAGKHLRAGDRQRLPCPHTRSPAHRGRGPGHHADGVVIPAEDGGYALIGMRRPEPALFSDVPWSTPGVMDETRRRLRTLGLTWHEPTRLWDVDLPHDLERMRAIGLHDLIPSGDA